VVLANLMEGHMSPRRIHRELSKAATLPQAPTAWDTLVVLMPILAFAWIAGVSLWSAQVVGLI
jgi:hypothetical protein